MAAAAAATTLGRTTAEPACLHGWSLFTELPSSQHLTIYTSYTVAGVVGTLLNALVLIVLGNVFKRRRTKSSAPVLLLSMTVADLVGSIALLMAGSFSLSDYDEDQYHSGSFLCRTVLNLFLLYAVTTTSGVHVVAISLERYFFCCHSDFYQEFLQRNNMDMVVSGVCWVLGFALQIYQVVLYDVSGDKCVFVEGDHLGYMGFSYSLVFIFTVVVAPSTLAWSSYQVSQITGLGVPEGFDLEHNEEEFAETRAAVRGVRRYLLLVVVVFVLTWLPIRFVFILDLALTHGNTYCRTWAYNVAEALFFFNCAWNPALYAFNHPTFKELAREKWASLTRGLR